MGEFFGSALLYGEPKLADTVGTFSVVAELSEAQYSAYDYALGRLRALLTDSHAAFLTIAVKDFVDLTVSAGDRVANGPIPGNGSDSVEYLGHRFTNSLLSVCSLLAFEQDKAINKIGKNYGKEGEETKKAKRAYNLLFDSNFGYRFLAKLRNVMHHDTMDVLSLQIHAEASGANRQGAADVRLMRAPLIESSQCNKQLQGQLRGLTEDPMVIEMMLQAVSGLRVVTRHLRPLVEPGLEDHCAVLRSFDSLYGGKNGQRMLGRGTIDIVDGAPQLPRYERVDAEILDFVHGDVQPVSKFDYETIPPFDPEVLARELT